LPDRLRQLDDRLRLAAFIGWCLIWATVVWVMVSPTPAPVQQLSDKLLHFASFAAISFAALSFCRSLRQLAAASLFCGVAGVLLELAHYFIPSRSFELADMAANLGGTAAGALLALLLLRPLQRRLRFAPAR
jgi:VanZ family protein